MKYLHRTTKGVRIVGDRVMMHDGSLVRLIDAWCVNNGATMQGRLDAAKRLLNRQRGVPVYVCPDVVLIPSTALRDYDVVVLNAMRIIAIGSRNDHAVIRFADLTEVVVPATPGKLRARWRAARDLNERIDRSNGRQESVYKYVF